MYKEPTLIFSPYCYASLPEPVTDTSVITLSTTTAKYQLQPNKDREYNKKVYKIIKHFIQYIP